MILFVKSSILFIVVANWFNVHWNEPVLSCKLKLILGITFIKCFSHSLRHVNRSAVVMPDSIRHPAMPNAVRTNAADER